MAKKSTKATKAEENGATKEESTQVTLNTLAQYIKDLSFENPRAPMSLQGQQQQPEINIAINVNASPLGETEYEVALKIEANAKVPDGILFNVELLYAGIFRITGVSEENVHPVVLIECPRLLFPFARQIIAEATRDGGFPPLMVDPVDFTALYRQRLMEAQEQQGKDAAKKN
ncbi:MAG: protein-export chaperone SecB [Hyphomicrobiales bacterium]